VRVSGKVRKSHYDSEPKSTPQLLMDISFGKLKDRSSLVSKDVSLQIKKNHGTGTPWIMQWTQELAKDEFHRPHMYTKVRVQKLERHQADAAG
jgi:hypothetical protein